MDCKTRRKSARKVRTSRAASSAASAGGSSRSSRSGSGSFAAGQQLLELVDHHQQRAVLAAQEPRHRAEPFRAQLVDLALGLLKRHRHLRAVLRAQQPGGKPRPWILARPDQRHRPPLVLLAARG